MPLRTPVYFLGIGGPNSLEKTTHPSRAKLEVIGKEITTKVKPRAVVVFSAHWQGGPNIVQVNVAPKANIIYDFYGFPAHYYEYKFPNTGSPELAERIIKKLQDSGIETERVERGLDHGVWAGFLIAFGPNNRLDVPIIQVSLFGSEDADQHYRLGQALRGLREEGILIVGTGMAAHNLLDFRKGTSGPYTHNFDEALKEAVEGGDIFSVMKRGDLRLAHPTLEHLLPLFVAAGAAGDDAGYQVWTLIEGSLSWAQYRFGGLEEHRQISWPPSV